MRGADADETIMPVPAKQMYTFDVLDDLITLSHPRVFQHFTGIGEVNSNLLLDITNPYVYI